MVGYAILAAAGGALMVSSLAGIGINPGFNEVNTFIAASGGTLLGYSTSKVILLNEERKDIVKSLEEESESRGR